ncbi:MFS transporter [Propionibacteriaceae bacterium Y2011]|uniref:MFS transporter n=1 Tax=Microlunatus sp. Y2014 TaxID=3418488 RepID=UPI003B4FC200
MAETSTRQPPTDEPPTDEPPTDESSTSRNPRRWRVLGLLAVAQFMLILDITVVTVAIPDLGADLGMGRAALTWVMSAYTLAFGGLMLLAGRAADVVGPRPLVLAGLALFTVASLAVGLAPSGEVVIGARVAQGVGAAMLSPAALSVVVRLFDGEERNKALGIWSSLGGVGAAAGVLVGGLLTGGPGWEWVFFVNVPVGVALLVALRLLMPPMPPWAAGARLDVVGAVLVTSATLLVIYGFIGAGEHGWGSAFTLGFLAAGVAVYGAVAFHLKRSAAPLVDPRLLTRRPVLAGTFVLFVATGLMVAVFFLGTFYLQQARGHGPLVTGLLFLPVALATMAGAQVGGRLIGRIGARTLGVAALLVAAAGLLVPALSLSTLTTVAAVSIGSAGLGALFVVAAATALGQVAPEDAGIASGVLNTSHEFGSSAGAAVISGVVAASLVAGTDVGFARGYLVAAVVAAVSAVVAAMLVPGKPR